MSGKKTVYGFVTPSMFFCDWSKVIQLPTGRRKPVIDKIIHMLKILLKKILAMISFVVIKTENQIIGCLNYFDQLIIE